VCLLGFFLGECSFGLQSLSGGGLGLAVFLTVNLLGKHGWRLGGNVARRPISL
jgi:hypothetical protein